MSGLIGKKNSTLKKESVKENKLLTVGVKAIKFWHEALTDGETSIPFDSLNMPADVALNGFSNPTPTELLAANLALFHTNVEVHSSLNQKLMEGLAYVVRNNQIKFINNYESVEGEAFAVVYKNDTITGTNVVDARPLTATGVLLIGETDFNVGEAFKTNNYPNDQIGEVLVFLDGVLQFRNVANATANPAADGNYEEVHSTSGFGVIIRFNDVFVADKNIVVVSRNLIAERPDISMMQLIESVSGQLDAMIPTLAVIAGVPESSFQAMANSVDLKAFNDKVTAFRSDIDTNATNINTNITNIATNTADILTKEDKFDNKWQRKQMTSNNNPSSMNFNNLVIGRTYRVHCSAELNVNITVGTLQIIGNHNGANVLYLTNSENNPYWHPDNTIQGNYIIFTATATTFTFSGSGMGSVGNIYSGAQTYAIIEELPKHLVTTDFT